MDIILREAQDDDASWMLDLNNANEPAVSGLDVDAFNALRDMSHAVLIAEDNTGERLGFVVLLAPERDYDSPNYSWFEQNLDSYLYVDRIVASPTARGKGVGTALYAEALEMAEEQGARWLAAEVNTDPPNPGSLAFHQRMGFEEKGHQTHEDQGKSVVMLARPTLNPVLSGE